VCADEEQVIEWLLTNGADPTVQNNEMKTPQMVVVSPSLFSYLPCTV
jgi:hypothetical protein